MHRLTSQQPGFLANPTCDLQHAVDDIYGAVPVECLLAQPTPTPMHISNHRHKWIHPAG